jgi:GNAT superfamily N-acetyltransferase
MRVRPATEPELPAVCNVLDGAGLRTDYDRLVGAMRREGLLVAVVERRVLGALVLEGHEITAIAVRPGRRGQGIGTELLEAAAERRSMLVAAFDERVAPFWHALGFESEPTERTRRIGYRYEPRVEK